MRRALLELLNEARNILHFRLRYPWVVYGKNVHVKWSTHFWSPRKLVRIGNNVGIGPLCEISCDLTIGNHVLIASAVGFLSRDAHSPYLTGTTMFDSPRGDKYRIVVEDDVWIGHGAIILSGVTIGRGSIVAAGAIVTRDVPPYSVVSPQASTVVKSRFSAAEIRQHEVSLLRQGVIERVSVLQPDNPEEPTESRKERCAPLN